MTNLEQEILQLMYTKYCRGKKNADKFAGVEYLREVTDEMLEECTRMETLNNKLMAALEKYHIVQTEGGVGISSTPTEKPYTFTLPIGDWSGDGHDKCKYYRVASNKPVEQVREVHFKAKDVTGVDIEELCSDYQDSLVCSSMVLVLKNLGFSCAFGDTAPLDYWDNDEDEAVYADDDFMVNLWVFLLMKTDPELKLELIPRESMLPFYGFDEKKRHIGQVGYGVME